MEEAKAQFARFAAKRGITKQALDSAKRINPEAKTTTAAKFNPQAVVKKHYDREYKKDTVPHLRAMSAIRNPQKHHTPKLSFTNSINSKKAYLRHLRACRRKAMAESGYSPPKRKPSSGLIKWREAVKEYEKDKGIKVTPKNMKEHSAAIRGIFAANSLPSVPDRGASKSDYSKVSDAEMEARLASLKSS